MTSTFVSEAPSESHASRSQINAIGQPGIHHVHSPQAGFAFGGRPAVGIHTGQLWQTQRSASPWQNLKAHLAQATGQQVTGQPSTAVATSGFSREATVTRVNGQVVIDTGAGDDQIRVTQDARTGDVTVSVNGESRTFTGNDRNNLVIRAGAGTM
ncbi:hypothetical protein [Chloracidobacterium aggregatum]|uniref:hypothetical protein n=1 Tax=Chloracidobacterium aggregatum TaxID=2851959 RepID=UPI001B8B3C0D|nr:hypothetical protein [Chloracidobacterium aggregatum]QUV84705.1 hypothetical protein J8C03_11365 [Chloracidobacterium sp. 2]